MSDPAPEPPDAFACYWATSGERALAADAKERARHAFEAGLRTQRASEQQPPIVNRYVSDRPLAKEAPEPLAPQWSGRYRWMRESPGWRERHARGGVRFDFRCQRCGHTIEDVTLGECCSGTKDGITIGRVDTMFSGVGLMLCTNCCPE